jgi:reactive intermediate/imine deaminase
MSVPLGLVVPTMPHPLLVPDQNPGWAAVRAGYEAARQRILESDADLLVLYSTGWPSVIGHQIQADPEPEWVHVDQDWHMLGSIPYRFRMDAEFAAAWQRAATRRGLHARTVAYRGFPIDTGSIVALKLLNPDNRLPATIVSCNMYADRAETLVLGKSARDAIERGGRRAVLVSVTALSSWTHPRPVPPARDRISSLQDDEWNRKLLELFGEGRLEDVAQLARTFTAQAHADSKLKGIWWLAAAMGQHNRYQGVVHAYAPVQGTGAAVISLTPSDREAAGHEFDEEDVERFHGDRDVMGGADLDDEAAEAPPALARPVPAPVPAPVPVASVKAGAAVGPALHVAGAPKPVGAYPHARRVGDLLFLSGVGPRDPATNAVPGGPVRGPDGAPLPYDAEAQTRATIENVKRILEGAGSSLDRVLDVTAFLIDMDRDFAAYNKVYAEYFTAVGATRTTLAISALPTPIAVELKVIAAAGPA